MSPKFAGRLSVANSCGIRTTSWIATLRTKSPTLCGLVFVCVLVSPLT